MYLYKFLRLIKMTTSWLTSIKPNTTPIMHRHSNCWFSGVYYFQDSPYSFRFKNPTETIDITTKEKYAYLTSQNYEEYF